MLRNLIFSCLISFGLVLGSSGCALLTSETGIVEEEEEQESAEIQAIKSQISDLNKSFDSLLERNKKIENGLSKLESKLKELSESTDKIHQLLNEMNSKRTKVK